MPIIRFPDNPSDGMIVELIAGLFYQFDSSTNSWNAINQNKIPLATPVSDGLMSKDDLKKLNELLIPPPQTKLRADQCNIQFSGGTVGLYSNEDSLSIKHVLSLKNPGGTSDTTQAWDIDGKIAGYDFRVNTDKIIEEATNRGNIVKKQSRGPKGNKGPKGEQGIDRLDTGPVGADGEKGDNAPFDGLLVNENIQLTSPKDDGSRAIVDVQTERIDENENYLIITRANVGNPSACPDTVSKKNFNSPWVLAIKRGSTKTAKRTEQVNDCGLVCTICSSSLYYINIDSIITKLNERLDKIISDKKLAKENAVRSWLKVMVTMFNEQKASLCCALENCKSRSRNMDARRYIEQARIQAAQSDHSIVIGSDQDKVFMDMDVTKDCKIEEELPSDNIIRGDCTKGECTVRITVDGKLHSKDPRFGGNAVKFYLPAGQYVAEVIDCCVATSVNATTNPKQALSIGGSTRSPHVFTITSGTLFRSYYGLLPIDVAIAPVNFSTRSLQPPPLTTSSVFNTNNGSIAFRDYIVANQVTLDNLLKAPDTQQQIDTRTIFFERAITAGKDADTTVSASVNNPTFSANAMNAYSDYRNKRRNELFRNKAPNTFLGGSPATEDLILTLVDEEATRVALSVEAYSYVRPLQQTSAASLGSNYTGRIAVAYQVESGVARFIRAAGGNPTNFPNSVLTNVVTVPDFGYFDTDSAARNVYLGLSTSFAHNGGDVQVWVVDRNNNPSDNSGKLEVCIKDISCVSGETGSVDITSGDGVIYLYRDEISNDNYLGVINPYTGTLSASANYGLDADGNANLTYGPTLEAGKFKVFLYDGSDGLSIFFIGNSKNGTFTSTRKIQVEAVSTGMSSSLAVKDSSSTAIVQTAANKYHGEWASVVNETFGGAVTFFNLNTNWSAIIEPTDLDGITSFIVEDASNLATSLIYSDPNGVGRMVSGRTGPSSQLISSISNVPSSFGGPYGMEFSNRQNGQQMILTRNLPDYWVPGAYKDIPISGVEFSINAVQALDIQTRVITKNNTMYTWSSVSAPAIDNNWETVNSGSTVAAVDTNGVSVTPSLRLTDIAKVAIIINNTPTGTPIASIGPIYLKLTNGARVIVDDFNYNQSIGFGYNWNFILMPRENSHAQFSNQFPLRKADQQARYSDVVARMLMTNGQTVLAGDAAGANVPGTIGYNGDGPFASYTIASLTTPYNALQNVQFGNNCFPKQPKTEIYTHIKGHLFARTAFVPSGVSNLKFVIRADDEITRVAVNGVIVGGPIGTGCPVIEHTIPIPSNLIKFNQLNTFGVLIRNFRDLVYADMAVTCDGTPDEMLRYYWDVGANNNVASVLNRIILSTIPPNGGCQMYYTKIQWYLRGHRIGAACSCFVDIGGVKYLIIKRSLGVDTSCGGGESLLTPCINQYISSGRGHPAIAWPSIDGEEGIGVPTSGFTDFVVDDALSQAVVNKITAGDITNVRGDPATNISFVIFPVI